LHIISRKNGDEPYDIRGNIANDNAGFLFKYYALDLLYSRNGNNKRVNNYGQM